MVPDPHFPRPVVPLRNGPGEGSVFHRVVLGLDGQVPFALHQREALGDGPGHQDPVPLQPQVVVEAGRVVALDDESVAARRRASSGRLRGPRTPELPHLEVPAELGVLGTSDRFLALRPPAGSLDPMGLGGRKRVVARDAHGLERLGDVLGLLEQAAERIGPLQARPHGCDREVLGSDPPSFDLRPRHGRRDGGTRLRPNRIHRGDVRAQPVHVVVDEHPGPTFDLPLHRHPAGVGLPEEAADGAQDLPFHGDPSRVRLPDDLPDPPDELADLRVGEPRDDRDVDLHAGRPGGLRVGGETQSLARHPDERGHCQDILEARRRKRIEIEEEVVRCLDGPTPGMQRVELDASEVGHEQQAGAVLHHQVVDDLVLGRPPPSLAGPGALHRAARHPVRRVRGRLLLVEVAAGDAVRHPFHGQRPSRQIRDDAAGDVEVVGDQVALRVALVGPEHLVQVRQA